MLAPRQIEFRSVAVPQPGKGQVLVRVKRIGICGSDIHVYHGKHPFTKYPITQGHEVSCEVVELGETVDQFRPRQKVTIEPQVYCGQCYPCTHGKYNLCESLKVMGFQTTGAASEYFAVDASKLTPLPDGVTFDQGCMIEPLAVTVHAARQAGDVAGKKIAILGAGPIGILLCQTLKALGAAQVLVTDVSDYRLTLARQCGADAVFNTKKVPFSACFVETFGPDKADFIYDCAGTDVTINEAIRSARKGSCIILVAVFAELAQVDLAVLNDHELDLNTSMMYRHEDFIEAIRLVRDRKVRLEPLMSKHFPMSEFERAYEYIDQNREYVMKVIIDMG